MNTISRFQTKILNLVALVAMPAALLFASGCHSDSYYTYDCSYYDDCGSYYYCDVDNSCGYYYGGYSDGSGGYYDSSGGSSGGYSDGSSGGTPTNSTFAGTKDVDLQKAGIQQASLNARGQFVANQFAMSVSSATQVVQLLDKVRAMTGSSQMTDADRAAVTQSALGIANVSADQVNDAIAHAAAGDSTAADSLMTQAAQNLGMPSADVLRNKLLPALRIQTQ